MPPCAISKIRNFEASQRPLPQAKATALFKQIASGGPKAVKAKKTLVELNQGLVRSTVKKVYHPTVGFEFNDLVQEGNLGLLKAIKEFDYKKGNKFSTYAYPLILHTVIDAIIDKANIVRIPAYLQHLLRKADKAYHALLQKNGVPPTAEDLAKATGQSLKRINKLPRIKRQQRPQSLDSPLKKDGSNNFTLHDLLPHETSSPEHLAEAKSLSQFYGVLGPFERRVLELYFGLGMNTVEIGEVIGYDRERIRQTKEKALEKLREASALPHESSPAIAWLDQPEELKLMRGTLSAQVQELFELTFINYVSAQKTAGILGLPRAEVSEERRLLKKMFDKMYDIIQKVGLENIETPQQLIVVYEVSRLLRAKPSKTLRRSVESEKGQETPNRVKTFERRSSRTPDKDTRAKTLANAIEELSNHGRDLGRDPISLPEIANFISFDCSTIRKFIYAHPETIGPDAVLDLLTSKRNPALANEHKYRRVRWAFEVSRENGLVYSSQADFAKDRLNLRPDTLSFWKTKHPGIKSLFKEYKDVIIS